MSREHIKAMTLIDPGDSGPESALERLILFDTAGEPILIGPRHEDGALVIELDAPTGDATGVGDSALLNAAVAKASAIAGASSKVVIRTQAGAVYKLAPSGSATWLNPSGSTVSYAYCVTPLPSYVTIDGQGSTFQLAGNTQAVLFASASATGTTRGTNVGVINATLDGRNVAFSGHSLARFSYVDGLDLSGLRLVNASYMGLWVFDATAVKASTITANNVTGQALQFGDPQTANASGSATGDNSVRDSQLGRLMVTNTLTFGTTSQPGNPIVGIFKRASVESMYARNCAAGIKIQDPTDGLVIGTVILDIGTSTNSGFKLQGGNVGSDTVKRVSVGQVICTNQTAQGLYLEKSLDCKVGSYTGLNNNTGGTGPDVWIGGTRDYVGSISSDMAGADGVYIRPYAVSADLPVIKVRNSGQVSGSTTKFGVNVAGGDARLGVVTCIDDQSTPTMTFGYRSTAANTVTVRRLESSGPTTAYQLFGSGQRAQRVVLGPPTTCEIVNAAEPTPITGAAVAQMLPSGRYVAPMVANVSSTIKPAQGSTSVMPIEFGEAGVLTAIGVNITAAGEAGSKARLSLWSDNGHGQPGNLIADFGVVAADAIAYVEISGLTQAVSATGYFLGVTSQLCPTTQPTYSGTSSTVVPAPSAPGGQALLATAYAGYNRSGDTGAFTANVAWGAANPSGALPRVAVKAA